MTNFDSGSDAVDDARAAATSSSAFSRRTLLATLGVSAALVTLPVQFARADGASKTQSRVISGHYDLGSADFIYVPVNVPAHVQQISVSYTYDKPDTPPGTPGNSCDIGIFDTHGVSADLRGFRGWSGGFRTKFAISRSEATPGYLPGDVQPGTWYVVLAPYQIAPQGMDWSVTITLAYGDPGQPYRAQYPPTSIRGKGQGWYRGDAHLHTIYSDGKHTPLDVAQQAREAKLDFIISTDHNTSSSHGIWGPLAGDDLLILLGEEVTTRNGHWLALGTDPGEVIDWRYRSRDNQIQSQLDQVHHAGGICASAHLYCPWIGAEWKFGFEGLDATEVWTGPWGWDDEAAVSTWANLLTRSARARSRTWLPAMGNSDAHNPGNVIGLPHNVVNADSLSQDALLNGIRAGRSWIAESSSVQLSLQATSQGRSAGIGEKLCLDPSALITVSFTVSGVPNGTLRLLTDEGQMIQSTLDGQGQGTLTWQTKAQVAMFVRAEVRHPMPDGSAGGTTMGAGMGFGPMAALTNPIWFDTASSRP